MMKGIYLLLGSNMGDRRSFLKRADLHIRSKVGPVLRRSSVYRTAAWGFTDQRDFYNQVLEVEAILPPVELLKKIEEIMDLMGRSRTEKWRERVIDIDILYYGDHQINQPDLIIPHPRIQERRFTLVPLCELAPEMMHPVLGLCHKELLEACEDKLDVYKI